MSRRKKPDGETPEEAIVRRQNESVADHAERSEKVAWDRKMDNMVSLLAKLKPIEDRIIDLIAEKTPLMDQIADLRRDMVRDCVHPYTNLLNKPDGTILCKFCNKTFKLPAQV